MVLMHSDTPGILVWPCWFLPDCSFMLWYCVKQIFFSVSKYFYVLLFTWAYILELERCRNMILNLKITNLPGIQEFDSPKHGTQLVTSLQSPFLRHLAIYLLKLISALFTFTLKYYIFNPFPTWSVLILALVISKLPPFVSFLWHLSASKNLFFLLTPEENRISKSNFNKN